MTTTNHMKLTAKEFRSEKNKRLTLLGMSGVGKTHLAKLIGKMVDGTIFQATTILVQPI